MRVTILGKNWNLRFVPTLGKRKLADCDAPHKPNKEIRIAKGLRGVEKLEAIAHECLHASGWHLDEHYVTDFARDLAIIIYKLGYHNEDQA